MFTCINCGADYDSRTGCTDERLCADCRDKELAIDKLERMMKEIGLDDKQRRQMYEAVLEYINERFDL